MPARAIAFLVMLALAFLGGAGPAWADGDPASDVLATQQLFLPQDAGIPAKQQAQIAGLLESAKRSGYPIRVALIASPTDLGSVTALWHQPQIYARFLGEELSLVYHGPLLVMMPNGFGFNGFSRPLTDERAAVKSVSPSSGGPSLGAAAVRAVESLAAKSGHSLRPGAAGAGVSVVASSGDALPLIALAVGAAIIVLAWGVSLRARPLHVRRVSAQ